MDDDRGRGRGDGDRVHQTVVVQQGGGGGGCLKTCLGCLVLVGCVIVALAVLKVAALTYVINTVKELIHGVIGK